MKKIILLHILMTVFILTGSYALAKSDPSDGLIHLRIVSINWENGKDISTQSWDNFTFFELDAELEIWNRDVSSYTYEHSDTCKFKANIDYQSTNNSLEGNGQYPYGCGQAITPIEYDSGISIQQIKGGISFEYQNATKLPLGNYRITTYLINWNSKDVGYNLGVNITINGEDMRTNYDPLPPEWGSQVENVSFQFPIILIIISIAIYNYVSRRKM